MKTKHAYPEIEKLWDEMKVRFSELVLLNTTLEEIDRALRENSNYVVVEKTEPQETLDGLEFFNGRITAVFFGANPKYEQTVFISPAKFVKNTEEAFRVVGYDTNDLRKLKRFISALTRLHNTLANENAQNA